MILKQLRLKNFRNYQEKEFSFSEGTTLVIGPNAAGKTNLLEAIYLLASGKSFRANLEQEMINWNEEIGRVKGVATTETQNGSIENAELEIVLTRGEVGGEKAARKKYLVNGVARRAMDFLGNLRAVYFGPEDLDLVTGSPSLRRKYLDLALSQVDREYARSSLSYEKGVRQRNKLLERIREEGVSRTQLLFWNQLLIRNGEVITQKREEFIQFVNDFWQQKGEIGQYSLIYDKSIISPARLEEYAEEEVAAAATIVGPHRDDFSMRINANRNSANEREFGKDLRIFGSRGEQRLAVLWLRICELEYIYSKTKARPVLLLDDIFSELDQPHRRLVLEITDKQQTIITTADVNLIEENYQKMMTVVKLD
ncbi:MAG: DNA replication and repair protein RecF [bacterium]|nr:DNA replication and repair protein RecF [bacterium]